MRYCLDYRQNGKYNDIIDELTIYVSDNHKYTDFLDKHKNQTIIITVSTEEDYKKFQIEKVLTELIKSYTNFKVKLPPECAVEEYITPLQKNHIPFFFDALVKTWTELHYYLKMQVSDMYIVEALGFELDKVHKILSDNKVSIRTFPNVAQKDVKNYDIYSFFIRPEDIDFYNQYIDVCEFFTNGIKNSETYYKIYAQDKKWFGDISEIIIGLTDHVDSRAIIGQFAKSRVKCGQKCLKGEPCNHCEKIVQLSELLMKANLLIDNK